MTRHRKNVPKNAVNAFVSTLLSALCVQQMESTSDDIVIAPKHDPNFKIAPEPAKGSIIKCPGVTHADVMVR